jgi:hypothetical protein
LGTDANFNSVFTGYTNLTSIIIPDGVTTIETYAFNVFSYITSYVTSITIPSSVTTTLQLFYSRGDFKITP